MLERQRRLNFAWNNFSLLSGGFQWNLPQIFKFRLSSAHTWSDQWQETITV